MPRSDGAPVPPRTLGDKLHHLGKLAPGDILAIETIVDDVLARRIAEQTARYLRLVTTDTPPD